jgi:hypothetical protein
MEKSTPRITVTIVLTVVFGLILIGCNPWAQTKPARIPDTAVANGSLEPRTELYLPELAEEEGRIWLETDPIQGWSNPWREWMWEEWIGRNYDMWVQTYKDYWVGEQGFPDCPDHCELHDGILSDRGCVIACLVKHYYLVQGIIIYAVETSTYQQKFGHAIAICEAEDCPAGYTLYVQVAETDIDTMLELGYRNIVTSCESIAPGIYVYGCTP